MYIVADIGGTKMRIAGTATLDRFKDPVILNTPESYEEGIALIIKTIRQISQGGDVEAIAMGLAGVLVNGRRSLVHSNVTDWNGRSIADDIEEAFPTRVLLENDTALVGLGEAVFGAGTGSRLLMYMTVSTGVNAIRIVNGSIDKATLGFETGDQYLFVDGAPGQLGDLISGKAVSLRYGVHPRELGQDSPVWEELAHLTSYGIYNSIVHWSPDRVVLGGSMFNKIGIPIDTIRKTLEEINVKYPSIPEVVHSSLGDLGGLYGGLARLRQLQ